MKLNRTTRVLQGYTLNVQRSYSTPAGVELVESVETRNGKSTTNWFAASRSFETLTDALAAIA